MLSAAAAWPGCGRLAWILAVEFGAAAHQHLEAHGGRNIGHLGKMDGIIDRQPADGGHHLGAVDQRQTFSGLQLNGLQTALAQHLLAGHFLPFIKRFTQTDQNQRQMGQRRQVAAGTHRPFVRHHRANAPVEKRDQMLERFQAGCRNVRGQDL